MEIWFKTDKEAIRLPVLPSEIKINSSSIITSVNILRKGEVPIFTGANLQTGEISCFLPNQAYSFNEYNDIKNPFSLALKFKEWCNIGQIVRLVITDDKNKFNINFRVRITDFEYGQRGGSDDIDYTLKWKEYRPIIINKLNNNSNTNSTNKDKVDNSTTDKKEEQKQKTYTVKKGDSLWAIAQKYYGKGSEYPKIKNANSSKYPSLKKNNIIYVNWVLVIP